MTTTETIGFLAPPETYKDFSGIADEYDFFRMYSSEYASILKIFARDLKANRPRQGFSVLDFGGGDGTLLADLYDKAGLLPLSPSFSIVEPSDKYRRKAEHVLGQLELDDLRISSALDLSRKANYDLIISNHVMYYVPDLRQCLSDLKRCLRPGSEMWLVMANAGNAIGQLCEKLFSFLDRPVPYHCVDALEGELRHLGISYTSEVVDSMMVFPDTSRNRQRLIKFILGDAVPFIDPAQLESQLDHLAVNGFIRAPLSDNLIRIKV